MVIFIIINFKISHERLPELGRRLRRQQEIAVLLLGERLGEAAHEPQVERAHGHGNHAEEHDVHLRAGVVSETDLQAGIGETRVQILLPKSPEWNTLKIGKVTNNST